MPRLPSLASGGFLLRETKDTVPVNIQSSPGLSSRVKPCAKAHRFAASGLDPPLHPGVLAAMSSTPQPAPQIGSPFAPLNHQTPSQGDSTPRPAGLSPPEIRDARGIQSA